MKKYKVEWDRDDWGYIMIEAESAKHAKELFESGQFKDSELVTRGGSIEFYRVDTVR